MAQPTLDLVFAILMWSLLGTATVLGAWALFWDRSRGRLRCPKCWYAMEGIGADAVGKRSCPECGRRIQRERSLRRTRRRWRWVFVAGLVAIMGVGAGLTPRIVRDGWLSIMPTTALIELLPLSDLDGTIGVELQERMGMRLLPGGGRTVSITPAQQVYMTRRIARGNILARPIGTRWRNSYGELVHRFPSVFFLQRLHLGGATYLDGTPGDDELLAAVEMLRDIPAIMSVRTRDRWPEGMPILIEFEVEDWWPQDVREILEIDWSANDGAATGDVVASMHAPFDVGLSGDVRVDLDVGIRQARVPRPSGGALLDRYTEVVQRVDTSIAYETVPTIDDAMTPVEGEEFEELLRTHARASWRDPALDFDTRDLAGTPLDGVALGLRVEIVHDGRVLGWHHMRGVGGVFGYTQDGLRSEDWRETFAYIEQHAGQGVWEIRISTDPEWALHVLDADRYWRGEITLPLTFE